MASFEILAGNGAGGNRPEKVASPPVSVMEAGPATDLAGHLHAILREQGSFPIVRPQADWFKPRTPADIRRARIDALVGRRFGAWLDGAVGFVDPIEPLLEFGSRRQRKVPPGLDDFLLLGAIVPGAGKGGRTAKEILKRGPKRPLPRSRTVDGYAKEVVEMLGGNPTVSRNGQELFRFRAWGHGQPGPSVLKLNVRNVAPSGKVFWNRGEGAEPVASRHLRELHKGLTEHGASRVRTRGGR